MSDAALIDEVIEFWFSEDARKHWFASTTDFDALIHQRFVTLFERARDGSLDQWMQSAQGCLALCIVLDQFPLHLFRGKAESFSTGKQAVACSRFAIESGVDQLIDQKQVAFMYMPLMHRIRICL